MVMIMMMMMIICTCITDQLTLAGSSVAGSWCCSGQTSVAGGQRVVVGGGGGRAGAGVEWWRHVHCSGSCCLVPAAQVSVLHELKIRSCDTGHIVSCHWLGVSGHTAQVLSTLQTVFSPPSHGLWRIQLCCQVQTRLTGHCCHHIHAETIFICQIIFINMGRPLSMILMIIVLFMIKVLMPVTIPIKPLMLTPALLTTPVHGLRSEWQWSQVGVRKYFMRCVKNQQFSDCDSSMTIGRKVWCLDSSDNQAVRINKIHDRSTLVDSY